MPRFTINHVGMAVPSIDAFLAGGSALYGDFARRGAIVNERQRVREMFLSDGRTTIELLEPLGEASPVSGFLKRNPRGGLIHLAFDVDELEPALAELGAGGARVVTDPIPDVAFDERRIAFVVLGGQVIELIERAR
jgi:methylmalonyl-CoA/ethylmalonyl-CoA epimerase